MSWGNFHSYSGSNLQPPPFHPASTNGGFTSGSRDSDGEQLALHFLEGNVAGIRGVTYRPVAPAGMAMQTLANLPITAHYLADPNAQDYDVLMDELVFLETQPRSVNHHIVKKKLGLSAMMRWLRKGGKGYEQMINHHDMSWWGEQWSDPFVQITRPGSDNATRGKAATTDEAVVAANIARTIDIWCFQMYGQNGKQWQIKHGDHLSLISRREKDHKLPVYDCNRVIPNLQDATWHWEILPISHSTAAPAPALYQSPPAGLWTRESKDWWHGRYWHLGSFHITLSRANNIETNFPDLARQYLYAETGVEAFSVWKKMRKVEILLKKN